MRAGSLSGSMPGQGLWVYVLPISLNELSHRLTTRRRGFPGSLLKVPSSSTMARESLASRVLSDHPRRDFGPFRPQLPKNARCFVRFGQRIAGKECFDAPLRDRAGRIVVGIIAMFTALTDEFGLTQPSGEGNRHTAHSCELDAKGSRMTNLLARNALHRVNASTCPDWDELRRRIGICHPDIDREFLLGIVTTGGDGVSGHPKDSSRHATGRARENLPMKGSVQPHPTNRM